MTTTKGENLGNINSVQVHLTAPLAVNYDVELRQLNLLVGMNGSGKSLILKLNWAFGTIMAGLVLSKEARTLPEIQDIAQYILDKTFEDQNFTGTLGAKFDKAHFTVTVDAGQITNLEYEVDSAIDDASAPVFMSTTLRTFAQMNQYLKTESLVKAPEDMLEMYRLYDVAFMERFKMKCDGGLKVSEEVKKTLKENFEIKVDVETISIENKSVVYTDSLGKTSSLAMLSNGEQSLINMVICNS